MSVSEPQVLWVRGMLGLGHGLPLIFKLFIKSKFTWYFEISAEALTISLEQQVGSLSTFEKSSHSTLKVSSKYSSWKSNLTISYKRFQDGNSLRSYTLSNPPTMPTGLWLLLSLTTTLTEFPPSSEDTTHRSPLFQSVWKYRDTISSRAA